MDSFNWRNWIFSGTWVYATGKPFTEPIGFEDVILPSGRSLSVLEFGEKNGIRLPSYHRLDLSASREFLIGETSKASAGVSVFNAYNNQNVWRQEFDVIENELIVTDVNYLGLTVSAFLNIDPLNTFDDQESGTGLEKNRVRRCGKVQTQEETQVGENLRFLWDCRVHDIRPLGDAKPSGGPESS